MEYMIDGIFLCKRITGIQRYAIEIIKELDKLTEKEELRIIVPERYQGDIKLNNIKIIKYGNKSDRLWEQVDFPRYLKKNHAEGLYFENTIPLLYRKGIVVVHDVSLKANKQLFDTSVKGKLTVMWRRIMYKAIMSSQMKLITVSEFSKREIEKYYGVNSDRITVIYNAWQHIENIKEDNKILQDNNLTPNKYYFALATLAPNKNFRWIVNAAINNPEETFVIAGGGKIEEVINGAYRDVYNLTYLGYVTDGQAKALMGKCKAFLFPSFYEGFGIPPLEAVASGAKEIILSDIPCLHEIYGENGTYIDPDDYSISIKNIKDVSINKEELLGRYSWEKSAGKIRQLINCE